VKTNIQVFQMLSDYSQARKEIPFASTQKFKRTQNSYQSSKSIILIFLLRNVQQKMNR